MQLYGAVMGRTLTMFLVGFWGLLGVFWGHLGVILWDHDGQHPHHVPGGLLGSFGVFWGHFGVWFWGM